LDLPKIREKLDRVPYPGLLKLIGY
jgi:hypothetical protein